VYWNQPFPMRSTSSSNGDSAPKDEEEGGVLGVKSLSRSSRARSEYSFSSSCTLIFVARMPSSLLPSSSESTTSRHNASLPPCRACVAAMMTNQQTLGETPLCLWNAKYAAASAQPPPKGPVTLDDYVCFDQFWATSEGTMPDVVPRLSISLFQPAWRGARVSCRVVSCRWSCRARAHFGAKMFRSTAVFDRGHLVTKEGQEAKVVGQLRSYLLRPCERGTTEEP